MTTRELIQSEKDNNKNRRLIFEICWINSKEMSNVFTGVWKKIAGNDFGVVCDTYKLMPQFFFAECLMSVAYCARVLLIWI